MVITGGSGTLGQALVKQLITGKFTFIDEIVVVSRNEQLQHLMASSFGSEVQFIIADIRDISALKSILRVDDYVIHAAAIKHIDISEMHPEEAIKTNVLGAMNLVEVAKEKGIDRLLAISSDKACNPNSTYGTTKLLAERIFVQANSRRGPIFANARFGNLLGSSGSVFHKWKEQALKQEPVTVTDRRMTRFFMKVDVAATFVLEMMQIMQGGETFIPKLNSFSIWEIAAFMTKCDPEEIGLRLGEKLHEELVSEAEVMYAYEYLDYFVVTPSHPRWDFHATEGERLTQSVSSQHSIPLSGLDIETNIWKYSISPLEFKNFLLAF